MTVKLNKIPSLLGLQVVWERKAFCESFQESSQRVWGWTNSEMEHTLIVVVAQEGISVDFHDSNEL